MMFAHPFAWMFLGLVVGVVCVMTLSIVAEARGQSRWFALWGLFGFAGLLAGLLIMLAVPTGPNPPAQRSI